jgi:hypothetical protein
VVWAAFDTAIQRGFVRYTKYGGVPLDRSQYDLLEHEIEASFRLALDDAGVELK